AVADSCNLHCLIASVASQKKSGSLSPVPTRNGIGANGRMEMAGPCQAGNELHSKRISPFNEYPDVALIPLVERLLSRAHRRDISFIVQSYFMSWYERQTLLGGVKWNDNYKRDEFSGSNTLTVQLVFLTCGHARGHRT
ncbi:hypothetical protein STEG23_022446, partial [Scotinomys teguina]